MQAPSPGAGRAGTRILLLLGLLLPALVLLGACSVTIGSPPPTPGPGQPTNTPVQQVEFNITPVNSPTAAPTAPPPPGPVGSGGTIKYTIKPGDVLSVIAQQYGTTVEDIVKVNNISDPNQIKAGDVILIPAKGGAAATHVASPTATPVR